MQLILNTKNKVGVIPFIGNEKNNFIIDYSDLIKSLDISNLSFQKSNFYFLEDKKGNSSLVSSEYLVPVMISGEYKEYKISDLSSMLSFVEEEIEIFSLSNQYTRIKSNVKLIDELLEDVDFNLVGISKIVELGEETGISVKDLIKKFIMIDSHLMIVSETKNTKKKIKKA